jgi:hypothetical protein
MNEYKQVVPDWSDGSFDMEIEIPVTVNYAEIHGKLYWQIFCKGDIKGISNLADYLDKDTRDHVTMEIADRLNKQEAENG